MMTQEDWDAPDWHERAWKDMIGTGILYTVGFCVALIFAVGIYLTIIGHPLYLKPIPNDIPKKINTSGAGSGLHRKSVQQRDDLPMYPTYRERVQPFESGNQQVHLETPRLPVR